MGWGTGGWGVTSWGVGTALADLFIVTARATSPRSVLVTLSREPLVASTIADGDALNPITWSVTDLRDSSALTVLSVAKRTATTFEILTLEKFAPFPNLMRVNSNTLKTPTGIVISSPTFHDFFGMEVSAPASRSEGIRDLKNPPFDVMTHVGGTLRVDSSGDYVNEEGTAFLRKLVYRRLMTVPGGFFHLPDYGLGIRLKEPFRTPDLNKLRKVIELQLLREPEFARVRVRLTLTSQGILTILVRAILAQTNQEIALPIEVPQGGVEL